MASGTAVFWSRPNSRHDVAVLPGKTGPDGLEPGLTGFSLRGSGMTGSRLLEPARWPTANFEVPVVPSFLPQRVLCCRGIVRESASAASRWSDPAPQSAWSSGRKRSQTERSIAATKFPSYWEQRKSLPQIRSIRCGSRIVSPNGTPVLGLKSQALSELHPTSQLLASAKQLKIIVLIAARTPCNNGRCATRCTL